MEPRNEMHKLTPRLVKLSGVAVAVAVLAMPLTPSAGRRAGPMSRETRAVARRDPSVKKGSASITALKTPKVQRPEDKHKDGDWVKYFPPVGFECDGAVVLRGERHDDLGGFQLGWIQVAREWSWAIYRGRSNDHGSMYHRRTGKPGNWGHECRDTVKDGGILADTAENRPLPSKRQIVSGRTGEQPMKVWFRDDAVSTYFYQQLTNTKTKQPNFLWEAVHVLEFCTVLTLVDPKGNFTHPKSIYWSVRWSYGFGPPNSAGVVGLREDRATAGVGTTHDGPPTLAYFADILTARTAPNCLVLATRSVTNPDKLKLKPPYLLEETRWKEWEQFVKSSR